MKIRHLLALAAASVAVASASAFEWTPVIQQPNPSFDVTQVYQLETMRVNAATGLIATDVMPIWIDENGNEISGTYSSDSDPDWGDYVYVFNFSDFKCNGEYILQFPEGMFKNAVGELSDPKEFNFTVEIPDLSSAMFDDFKVLYVYPDFSQPQGIWENQSVKIDTNHNDAIGYTELILFDKTTGESHTSSNFTEGRTLGVNSAISWEVVGSFKFYEDHEYSAEFVFYNGTDKYSSDGDLTPVVARETYNFTGKVDGYKYSDITLLSISPTPGSLISDPSQAVFTYTFSGPVNVYKATTPKGQFGTIEYPASCLSSNEDKTVWTLDLSNDEYVQSVDAELVIYLYVRDLEGSQLKGDDGEGNDTYYIAAWQCDLGAKEIIVVSPESGETLDSLTEIVIKSVSGEEMSYNWGSIAIENLLGQTLGTLLYEQPDGEDGGAAAEFHFTKWIPEGEWSAEPLNIVAEGSYKIFIPTGTFVFGEQFESVNSRSLTSSFFISGGSAVDPQEALKYDSVYPEMDSEVKSLDTIVLTFVEPVACEDFEVSVYNVDGLVVATGIGRSDLSEPNRIVVVLNQPIVADGKYIVVIPNHVIVNGDYYDSDGAEGLCNPEYKLYYTVASTGSDDPVDPSAQEVFNFTQVDPVDGSTVNELSHISLWFPDVVMTWNTAAYVYKADATDADPVAEAVISWDMMDDYLINVNINAPVIENGEYVLVIPARSICDDAFYASEGKSGICNPEIRLHYVVSTGLGVDAVDAASLVSVYDVQGRVVLRNASSAQLKSLPKGIYVVGGKKLVVK